MSNFGIKVVNAGTSTSTTDIRDQIMNSQYSMFKYHSDGTANAVITAGGTVAYGTVSHGLGYVPSFMAYTNDLFLPYKYNLVPSISVGTATPNWYPSVYANTASVIVQYNFPDPYNQVDNDIDEYYDTLISDGQQWIVGDVSGGGVDGAFRFVNVTLSGTTTIVSAVIEVEVTATGTATTNTKFSVYGIDEDNTNDFSSDPMGRSRTTATYNQEQAKTSPTYTMDINVKTCLEEIIARVGWSSGNAMGFLTFNNSSSTNAYIASDSNNTTLKVVTGGNGTIPFRVIIFKDKII